MADSAFLKLDFFVWILFAFVMPISLYGALLMRQTITRRMVIFLGALLIFLAGSSVVLLQTLSGYAKESPSLFDDRIFLSGLSLALYLLPAVFAGIGTNMVSHVLIQHLASAERRYDALHKDAA